MRERGLKSSSLGLNSTMESLSLPMRERGLKSADPFAERGDLVSLPMRERGLKLEGDLIQGRIPSRSPCGSVE